ncbi:cytochrome P450 3A12-like [Dreissena polymorpha]|uniref:Cytochrome P450 n=1 Tax=Dreissena polymorpha TaxID=45954 RepID=A0A9D4DEB7_DREPO|nr:cytochrome P450 3A12-like [Dreissena polymorpha]XP_052234865.1 cytochrome P450 3A12-like [Dreissena polymorpha]KAH3746955.1 hypothetical protein DPMN_181374 [Dreissena polymorpha]
MFFAMSAFQLDVNPYLLLAFVAMVTIYIFGYMKETYGFFQSIGIPGPKPVWVFGNVQEFKEKSVLTVFEEWKKVYGSVYGFYEGFRPSLVVNDPEFARDILTKNFDKFHIRTKYRPFEYYPGNLRITNLGGEHWKNQRALLNRMIHSTSNLSQLVSKIEKASTVMLQALENALTSTNSGINISRFVDKFASEAVIRMVLDMSDEEIRQYGDTILTYEVESNWSAAKDNHVSGLATLFPSLAPFLKIADVKHRRAHDAVVKLLRDYIPLSIASQNNNHVKANEHYSLLSYLTSSNILTRDVDGSLTRRSLSTDEIIAHLLTLEGEIFTSITASIQFILYELAMNEDCQERLVDEINSIFKKDDEITSEQLVQMKYFDMCFNETFRKHPVAPGVSRVCTEDCTIRGVRFKRGLVVRVMNSPIYNDERIFSNPETFNPDRFSNDATSSRHPYSFLPFGQGPRGCPGQKLAIMIMRVAIVSLLRKFKIQPCSETEMPLKETFRPSLCPANGVFVTLVPRMVCAE